MSLGAIADSGRRPLGEALLAWGPALLIAALALAHQLAAPLNHDTAWYLDATGRWLDGAELYHDVVEVNPPLAFWLTALPLELARLLGLPAAPVFLGAVAVLALAMLALCRRLLEDTLSGGVLAALTAGVAVALLAAPLRDFGQREHLLLILVTPYLLLTGLRADGRPVALRLALAVGVLAALGFALKPQTLLVPLALEVLVLWRRCRLLLLLRPEVLAGVAVALVYGVAIALITPDYLTTIVPFALEVYDGAYGKPWGEMIGQSQRLIFALVLAGLLLPALRDALGRGCADALLLAAAGFFIAFLLQGKGWTYQSYPAFALCIAAVPLILGNLAALAGQSRHGRRIGLAGIAVLVGLLLLDGGLGRSRYGYASHHAWTAMAATQPGAETIYVFSSNVWATYEWAPEAGLRSVSPYPTQWLLPGLVRARAAGRESETLDRIEAYIRDSVVETFSRTPPDLVTVDARRNKSHFGGVAFDYLEWLLADPRFADLWRAYRPVGLAASYHFYGRNDRPTGF